MSQTERELLQRITTEPGKCGGKPYIRGIRIRVTDILDLLASNVPLQHILADGFLRLRCGDCGHDKLVAFSCKRRGFCPSCGTRRMAQTAANLVEHVIPHVPVRSGRTSPDGAGRRTSTRTVNGSGTGESGHCGCRRADIEAIEAAGGTSGLLGPRIE